jgi:hypothetical protein
VVLAAAGPVVVSTAIVGQVVLAIVVPAEIGLLLGVTTAAAASKIVFPPVAAACARLQELI